MRPDEECIVPDCDEATFSGAKPIYIRLTVDGKRTLKKVGALCKKHLPDGDVGDWLPSAKDESKRIMSWLVSCPADDVNFIGNLQKASLPLLRRVLERLEDELRRGFPHKTRIKKVTARIRALEKELLKEDAERILKPGDVLEPGEKVTIPHDFPGQGIVDQVLPRKKLKDAKLSVADWREISELGKRILPGTEKVHCDDCGCDNVPDKDGDGNVFCAACGALIEAGGIDWSASIEKGEEP